MDKWEAAGKALPVVVVGRGVEEGPELGHHRQGCDKLFQAGNNAQQEEHCQRSVPSGTLNAKDGKNLGFLPRVRGAIQDMGLEEVWTACGQVGRAEVVRPMRGWRGVVCTSTWAYPFTITSRSREAKPESQTGLGSKP